MELVVRERDKKYNVGELTTQHSTVALVKDRVDAWFEEKTINNFFGLDLNLRVSFLPEEFRNERQELELDEEKRRATQKIKAENFVFYTLLTRDEENIEFEDLVYKLTCSSSIVEDLRDGVQTVILASLAEKSELKRAVKENYEFFTFLFSAIRKMPESWLWKFLWERGSGEAHYLLYYSAEGKRDLLFRNLFLERELLPSVVSIVKRRLEKVEEGNVLATKIYNSARTDFERGLFLSSFIKLVVGRDPFTGAPVGDARSKSEKTEEEIKREEEIVRRLMPNVVRYFPFNLPRPEVLTLKAVLMEMKKSIEALTSNLNDVVERRRYVSASHYFSLFLETLKKNCEISDKYVLLAYGQTDRYTFVVVPDWLPNIHSIEHDSFDTSEDFMILVDADNVMVLESKGLYSVFFKDVIGKLKRKFSTKIDVRLLPEVRIEELLLERDRLGKINSLRVKLIEKFDKDKEEVIEKRLEFSHFISLKRVGKGELFDRIVKKIESFVDFYEFRDINSY